MKLRTPYGAVAVIALALWVTIVAVQVVKGGRYAWALPYILPGTPIAVLVTFFLCRFRVAHKKPLSYGTLLAGPFGASILVILCYRFYYHGWSIFTPDYWLGLKGGWGSALSEMVRIGGICALPAIAIVVYYQNKTDEVPLVKQDRIVISEKFMRPWRWTIEMFCTTLLLLFLILRYGTPITVYPLVEEDLINFGSCFMILLFATSMISLRHHWRHGLFGLLVIVLWFVSVIFGAG